MTNADTGSSIQAVAAPAERVVFALRQAALLGLALLVAGMVTERLRPDEALDRGIASTVYLWAIVVWVIVLVVNAVAFERSQTHELERIPLAAAAIIAAVTFVIGLISLDAGSTGARLIYVFASSIGALMFWWAVIGLGLLLVRLVADQTPTRI